MNEVDYDHLVQQQSDRLYSYAAWTLGDLDGAGDVAQEAFLRLWRDRHRVAPGAGGAWLFRTAHRLCIDRVRRRATRAEVPLDIAVIAKSCHHGHTGLDALQNRVADGLARLNAKDRTLIVLRDLLDMPVSEIGVILDKSLGSVRVDLHRARAHLKRELDTSRNGH
jgi:RNA polymerase sigma-70 factor (ECF subfamily)